MKIKHSKVLTIVRGISSTKGSMKLVRDKNGDPIFKKDEGGEAKVPVFELKAFDISPKGRFHFAQNLDELRDLATKISEFRGDLLTEKLKEKTARLRLKDEKAEAATDLNEVNDPEHGPFIKEWQNFLHEEIEVALKKVNLTELRLGDNKELDSDILADLSPILEGEI